MTDDMGNQGEMGEMGDRAIEGSLCLQLQIWIVDRTPVLFCATGRGEGPNRS